MIERSIIAQSMPSPKKSLDSSDKYSDATKQQAWIRAMEQEQLTSWLRNGVIGHDAMVTNSDRNSDPLFEKQSTSVNASSTSVKEQFNNPDSRNNRSKVENKVISKQEHLASSGTQYAGNAHVAERADTEALNGFSSDDRVYLTNIESSQMLGFSENAISPDFAEQSSQLDFGNYELQPAGSGESLQLNDGGGSTVKHGIDIKKIELACRQLFDQVSLKLPLDSGQHVNANGTSVGNLKATYLTQFQLTNPSADDSLEGTDELSPPSNTVKNINQDRMSATQQEPLRFHSEWHDEGVKVWLGIDHANSFDVSRLIAEIKRWAVFQNLPIAEIICNGKSVVKLSSNQQFNFDLNSTDGDTKQLEQDAQSVVKHFLLNKYIA